MVLTRDDRAAEDRGRITARPFAPRHGIWPRAGRSLLGTLHAHAFSLTVLALIVILVVTTFQVVYGGPIVRFDHWVHDLQLPQHHPALVHPVLGAVEIGQRAPSVKPALVIGLMIAWHRRQWRPVLVVALSLLVLNVIVGAAKVYTARLVPATGSVAVFVQGGNIYPSGHSSNVVVTWGIVAYVVVRYGPLRSYKLGIIATVLASLVVGLGSIFLDTHWVSDITAGWFAGALILMAVIKIDLMHVPRPVRPPPHPSAAAGPAPPMADPTAGPDAADRVAVPR